MEKSPEIKEIWGFFFLLSPLSPILKKLIGKRKIKNKIVFLEIGDNGDKLPLKPKESPYLWAFYVSPLPVFPGTAGTNRGQLKNFPKSLRKPVFMGFSWIFLLVFRGQRGQLENFVGTNRGLGDIKKLSPVCPRCPRRGQSTEKKESENMKKNQITLTVRCGFQTVSKRLPKKWVCRLFSNKQAN